MEEQASGSFCGCLVVTTICLRTYCSRGVAPRPAHKSPQEAFICLFASRYSVKGATMAIKRDYRLKIKTLSLLYNGLTPECGWGILASSESSSKELTHEGDD